MTEKPRIIAQTESLEEEARALSQRLGIPYEGVRGGDSPQTAGRDGDPAATGGVYLRLGGDGLALCAPEGELRADLTHMLPRLSQRNLASELLVKAAKIKGDRTQMLAVDATAGFGEDALLLAAAGYQVLLYERNPYIAELLADAMRRAREDAVLAPLIGRMELVRGDSIEALSGGIGRTVDVILLDPMFPERTKSAAVRKKFQVLHHLEEPCADGEKLLGAAIAARPKRIVIKRPVKGEYLAGVKPAYSLTGKAVRVDVILP